MSKTKLLSSVSILLLVLSLGSCSESESSIEIEKETEGNIPESENTSETTKTVSSPSEFIDYACECGNYSAQIVLYEFSSDSVASSDVQAGTYDSDALINSMVGYEYDLYLYYTEQAYLVVVGYYVNYNFVLYEELLYINDYQDAYGDIVNEYLTYDGYNWYQTGIYYNHWQYWFHSLFDNETTYHLDESDFIYYYSGLDTDGLNVDLYAYKDQDSATKLSYMIGVDIWDSNLLGYLEQIDDLYFYPDLGWMYVSFYSLVWYYTDSSMQYERLFEDQFYVTFYDVGTTDISSLVDFFIS